MLKLSADAKKEIDRLREEISVNYDKIDALRKAIAKASAKIKKIENKFKVPVKWKTDSEGNMSEAVILVDPTRKLKIRLGKFPQYWVGYADINEATWGTNSEGQLAYLFDFNHLPRSENMELFNAKEAIAEHNRRVDRGF